MIDSRSKIKGQLALLFLAEIIEIPVGNNKSVSEYTPQQVGGILGGFILAGLLVTTSRKNQKSRSHMPKRDRKQLPDLNINDWDSRRERLMTFGRSKYRGTMFYVGPKDEVYYITYRGTKVYC